MSSDATAVPPPRQLPGKNNTGFWKIFLAILLMLSGLGLITLIVLAFFGGVSGEEFDALTWSARSFRFGREPITGLQVSGARYVSTYTLDASIAPYIKGGSLVPPTSRWDLVSMYRGSAFTVGRAQVLLDYLQADDVDGNAYWDTWTVEHPQAAAVLWPVVRDCVHLPRYDRLPEIFETARAEHDPMKLQTALSQIMVALALEEAQGQATRGDQAASSRAAKLGLLYDANSTELKRLAAGT